MLLCARRAARVLRALAVCSLIGTSAGAKETVKVGFIGPLTGGVSAIGIGGRNSAELAVRLKNLDRRAKYTYKLVSADDECKPAAAAQRAAKMAANKDIVAAVTHYCSPAAAASVGIYHKSGFPIVIWGAELPDITYRYKYPEIHRVNGTMIKQNETNAEHLTGLGYKTFVIIHDTTETGYGHMQYFAEALEHNGGKILGTFSVGADQQDLSAELTQISALKPDVVYFGGLTPLGIRVRSQMDSLGINAVFDGTSGIVSDDFIRKLGPLAEGTLAFQEGAPLEKLPGGKFFLEKYAQQKFDHGPEAYGPFAFAAMSLILDAIEKAGPNCPKIIEALRRVENRDTILGKVTFDDYGQNTIPAVTKYVIQDGKFVVWEDSEYASGKRKLPGHAATGTVHYAQPPSRDGSRGGGQ